MRMKIVNGGLSTAMLSNVINPRPFSVPRAVIFFAALGALGVVLHASLRVPMHLPGHHGLEWMAILTLACLAMPRAWTATGVGLAATAFAFLPVWGWHEPLAPLLYLASALLFDVVRMLVPGRRLQLVAMPLAAGLAFTVAGLISLLAGPHGVVAHAAWQTWCAMHFGFGLAGALVALQISRWTSKRPAPLS